MSTSATDNGNGVYAIEEGEVLTVECAAQASPSEITYRWTKEDESFTPQDSATLTISNIERTEHDGTYTCTATNQMTPTDAEPETGTGTESVTISVECKCRKFPS